MGQHNWSPVISKCVFIAQRWRQDRPNWSRDFNNNRRLRGKESYNIKHTQIYLEKNWPDYKKSSRKQIKYEEQC